MRPFVKMSAWMGALGAVGSLVSSLQSAGANPPRSAELAKPRQFMQGPPLRGDNTYVPITPCRIVDTRKAGGPVVGGTTRGVQVRGSSGFTAQGGSSTGCGVPASAVSVALSVTSTGAAKDGFLIGYPGDSPKPSANFAWFWQDRTSTSNPTLALSRIGTTDLDVYASATTQLIVDVAGYYEPQIEALVNSGGVDTYSATPRVVGVTHLATGVYEITVDVDVIDCTVFVTPTGSSRIAAATTQDTTVDVSIYNVTSVPATPVDSRFNFLVTC